MSNLSALRTTLKKLGSNAAQFFRPPAIRSLDAADEDILAGGVDTVSPVRLDGIAEGLMSDGVVPASDTHGTSTALIGQKIPSSAQRSESRSLQVPVLDAPISASQPWADLPRHEVSDDLRAILASSATAADRPKSTPPHEVASATAILTAEQKAIAEAPADERQLVIAGPGTGKTFTVIRRLEYLLGPGGLDVSQILILSFSRSAVREIRTRLHARVADDGAHGDLDYLQVRTFDSFAYNLLVEVGQTPSLSADSYDQNILQASRMIKEPESDARQAVASLHHLIVDELQDLVGPRALLVENMLKAMGGGFTLLGDPAQAIYDYQARQAHGPSAISFLRWLRKHCEQWHLQERSLGKNLRGSAECFAVSERHRLSILETDTAHAALGPLGADLRRLPDFGTVSEVDDSLRRLPGGKTAAILCRTNNEALQVHMHLLEQEIPHVLAVNVEDVGLPAWIGRVFSTWARPDIMQAQFTQLWVERIGSEIKVEPDQAWYALLHAMGKPDGTRRIRMEELRKALTGHPELPGDNNEDLAAITVSTIHRAKGREYDWVIVLDSKTARHGKSDRMLDAEEARILYVAATRARERLSRLPRGNLGKPKTINGRGCVILRNGDTLVEVGARKDVDDRAGVSASSFLNPNAANAAQDYLWRLAIEGPKGAVNLVRERPGWGYSICKSDAPLVLGHMSSSFGDDMMLLSMFLTGEIGNLCEVPVRSIETMVLGNLRDDIHMPYGQSGMYLAVRLQGLVVTGKWEHR